MDKTRDLGLQIKDSFISLLQTQGKYIYQKIKNHGERSNKELKGRFGACFNFATSAAIQGSRKKVIFFSGATTKAYPPPSRTQWKRNVFLFLKQLKQSYKKVIFSQLQGLYPSPLIVVMPLKKNFFTAFLMRFQFLKNFCSTLRSLELNSKILIWLK